jgi:hypothetical protein
VFVFGLTFARATPGLRHFLAGACVAAGLGTTTADGIETGHVLLLCASVVYGWYLAKAPPRPANKGDQNKQGAG